MTNCPAGSQGLVLGGDHDLDTEVGIVEELSEYIGSITGGEDDARDTRIARPGDLVDREGDARDGEHRLGCAHGQGSKASPLTSDEQHRLRHVSSLPYLA